MKCLTLELPAMYADHHVTEVKRILAELPGIGTIYASSAFQTVEIEYDESLTGRTDIEGVLDAAGYLSGLAIPNETREPSERPFFRHTAAAIQVGKAVNFTQDIPAAARPLWPCPGIGLLARTPQEVEELENA